ncbi:hypothetical protein DBADOPDK_01656 [Pseudomonas sp. MM223]|nr:hypothetical protein DBADOPDK_01656 [Pseudomonas sp. MM223]
MSAIFINRVARVLVGTLGAQLITIGVTLLLVRLYSPAEMGAFSAWFSFATIFAVMVTGRYELAIFSTKAKDEFHAVIKLVVFLTVSISVLVAGGLVLVAPLIDALPSVVHDYWLGLAVVSFGLGANKLVLSLLTYQQSFNRLGGRESVLQLVSLSLRSRRPILLAEYRGLFMGSCLVS